MDEETYRELKDCDHQAHVDWKWWGAAPSGSGMWDGSGGVMECSKCHSTIEVELTSRHGWEYEGEYLEDLEGWDEECEACGEIYVTNDDWEYDVDGEHGPGFCKPLEVIQCRRCGEDFNVWHEDHGDYEAFEDWHGDNLCMSEGDKEAAKRTEIAGLKERLKELEGN